MTENSRNNIQKFYQSSKLSSEMAIHMLQNKRDFDAIRMLWEAYSFSSDERYLEKIAIVYSVVGGAEEESLNILLRLFAKRPKTFSQGKEMLILGALQYRMRVDGVSFDKTPREKRERYIEFIENWAEAIGMEAEIKDVENFFIVNSSDLRNNKLLKHGVKLLEAGQFTAYDDFIKDIIYDANRGDLEFLITHFLYESLQFTKAVKTSHILLEELVKISPDNLFALICAFAIAEQKKNVNYSFDLESLSVNVIQKLIENNEEQKLADALIAFPNDIRLSKSIEEGVDFLINSPNHTIPKIYALVRHLLVKGKTKLANEYLKMGLALYPRSPLFKFLKWVFAKKINPILISNYNLLSKKLTIDLLKEIDRHETFNLTNTLKNTSSKLSDIVENRLFLEHLTILFYLGNIDNISTVLDRLILFSNSHMYFDFLLQEVSSIYHNTNVKISIYSAIQHINENFSGNVILLLEDDILHKKISSVKFDISGKNYFNFKKLFAQVSASFFLINMELNNSLLKRIVTNLYEIIQEDQLNIEKLNVYYITLIAYLELDNQTELLKFIAKPVSKELDKAQNFFLKYIDRFKK